MALYPRIHYRTRYNCSASRSWSESSDCSAGNRTRKGIAQAYARSFGLLGEHHGEFDPFGDYDLIFGAVKQNLKVVEVPVTYRARTYGVTNISRFRHGLLLFKMSWVAFKKIKWLGKGR